MRLLDRRDRRPVRDSRPRFVSRGLAAALAMGLVGLVGLADVEAQRTGATTSAADTRDSPWVVESWTVKDGLPVNSINALVQDHAGYIWAATFDGLVRFDGVRFTVFNTATSQELPSNRIIALQEGRAGALWLATEQLDLVRFRDGRFTTVPFEQARSGERITTLLVDSAGSVWVGTTRGLWTVRGDRLVPVGRGTLDVHVVAIMQRRDGSLCIGTSAGAFRVATEDGRVTKLLGDPAFETDSIDRIHEDAAGSLWMAGERSLWSWRGRPAPVMVPGPLEIRNLAHVPATGEMFAETRSGVYRIDAGGAVLVQSRSRTDTPVIGLWADEDAFWTVAGRDLFRDGRRVFTFEGRPSIRTTLLDREGSLWLGTEAGLYRLMPALFATYGAPEGVTHDVVYPTFVDRSGAVWLGTWGNGASRLDPATGRVTRLAEGLHAIVNTFHEDAAGRLWVGAGSERAEGGVYVCVPASMTCRADGPPELRNSAVFALHGDADGRLWAGAVGGLFRYDGRTWTRLPASPGVPGATVRAFAGTRDGALWMGTNGGGLARYREGTFTTVTHADGLPIDLIRSLHQDADGWLWVGTEGRGLARLDPRAWGERSSPSARDPARRIVRIGTSDGLFDEVIHQILEDDAGRLWMNTNRGVFWVARADLNAFAEGRIPRVHSTSYTERDGMRNREGNGGVQPAGAKGPDGRLWFPTQAGVVVVDPAMVLRDRLAPSLVVEQVVTGGTALRPEGDSITLSPAQRDVQIEYTALTYRRPANVRFRYRLDGYDAGWVDAGGRRAAFYTKLPPGRYTFRVETSDAGGGWHESGAGTALRVLPRPWETGAFRWSAAAALGLLLLAAFRVREARLRARAVQLEQVVDERTAALRERERELAERNAELQSLDRAKTNFFANVSHEFRTPLTLIVGPLRDLAEERRGGLPGWLRAQHEMMLRNAQRLQRLVDQVLDLAKLEGGALALALEPHDLVALARAVTLSFTPLAERRGVTLRFHPPVEGLHARVDAEQVEKVLANLLSNAFKFTESGGAIEVVLRRERDDAVLEVRDSGSGIAPDQLPRVFDRFYQADSSATRRHEGTGIGLSLVRELVELHGGTVGAESTVGVGSTFRVRLPLLPVAERPREETAPPGTRDGDAPRSHPAAELSPDPAENGEAGRPGGDGREEESADRTTVLVVDDNADIRAYVRSLLEPTYRVLEAADGQEGLERARETLPDLVLADVMMPRLDGVALSRALRAEPDTDCIPVVLLTARAGADAEVEGLEAGADDYITKPFHAAVLEARVSALIASRRRLRERFRVEGVPAPSPAAAPSAPRSELEERLRGAVEANLTDPDFGPEALAAAVGLSYWQMYRRLGSDLSATPSQFIRGVRVERAAQLLKEDAGSVTEIAYSVGFNSLSHFHSCFRERFGTSPSASRRTPA